MEILLLDGFDQAPAATNIAATLTSMGYEIFGDGALSWAPGREDDSQALVLSQADDTVALERSLPWNGDVIVIGFAVMATERAQLLSVSGESGFVIGWDDDGMHLRDQVSTAKPIRNRWYYLEVELDKANNICQLYINGDLDMTAPLPDGMAGATQVDLSWAGVNPTNVAGQEPPTDGTIIPSDIAIDDLYVADEVLSPQAIQTRFPDADVLTEWTAANGGPHYEEVTQQPPDAGHYITSFTTGARDTFTSSKTLPEGATITAAAITVRARKGDIDDRAIGLLLGDDEELQSELTLEAAYYTKYFQPGEGETWDAATLESLPFGVAVR